MHLKCAFLEFGEMIAKVYTYDKKYFLGIQSHWKSDRNTHNQWIFNMTTNLNSVYLVSIF